ncbi:MAG: Ig-like domain-containing protein [Anaeromyxobacteraceae bacterium]
MNARHSALLRLAAAVAVLVSHGTAQAVLLDHGPGDANLTFPIWYRDLNGTATGLCLSQTPSPNPGAGLKPMCFPLNADPTGFAGNVGPELFYNDLTTSLSGPNFSLKYVAALEGTYLPAGKPVHGSETVFSRVRIIIATQTPGTYKVTHPYGVEVFNVGPFEVGPRAVFFTADVPLGVPLDFNSALNGRLGPFVQWDFVDPGLTLSLTTAAGATETFLGDPNFSHTYQGSPFGTNYVRVDGPPGSNISGIGDDFMSTPLGFVLGQQYGLPIPTALNIQRATYSRDPVKNVTSIDVFATSAPANELVLTGAGLPSVQMAGDTTGRYFAHVEIPATAIPPASVTVTNATSNPVNSVSQALIDLVNVTSATFDTLTRTLKVSAVSSDLSVPPPAITVDGPLGGPAVAGTFTGLPLAAGVLPPRTISVQSSAGGVDSDDVVILPGLTDAKPFAPVAVADAFTTPENTAVNFNLAANDAIAPPALISQVIVVSPPLNGKAAPIGINTGIVTFTPNLNFFGADSFQYVVVDSTGAVSNVATAAVTVTFVAIAPKANPDSLAMVRNTVLPLAGKVINVLANDTVSAGTALNPASVVVTVRPLHGNAVANPDGTVTYTPVLNYIGSDTFQYTVANTAGGVSPPATVTIVVEGGVEILTPQKVTWNISKTQWSITASTNWFSTLLTQTTVTCYVGRTVGGPLIGTAPIDTAGKFQLVPGNLTTPPPDATNTTTCQTSNGGVQTFAVTRL